MLLAVGLEQAARREAPMICGAAGAVAGGPQYPSSLWPCALAQPPPLSKVFVSTMKLLGQELLPLLVDLPKLLEVIFERIFFRRLSDARSTVQVVVETQMIAQCDSLTRLRIARLSLIRNNLATPASNCGRVCFRQAFPENRACHGAPAS